MNTDTYKGYDIRFNKYEDVWEARDKDNECVASHQSRKALLELVDKLAKAQFKRFDILYGNRLATITSITFEGAWISFKKPRGGYHGSREKLSSYSIRDLRAANPANIKRIKEIEALEKQTDKCNAEIDHIKQSFDPLPEEHRAIFRQYGFDFPEGEDEVS